jgi:hypothetical protein
MARITGPVGATTTNEPGHDQEGRRKVEQSLEPLGEDHRSIVYALHVAAGLRGGLAAAAALALPML